MFADELKKNLVTQTIKHTVVMLRVEVNKLISSILQGAHVEKYKDVDNLCLQFFLGCVQK